MVRKRLVKNYRYNAWIGDSYEYQYLVRCNYGWGGAWDGYYVTEVFRANYENGGGPQARSVGEKGYYKYKLEMIYAIQPSNL